MEVEVTGGTDGIDDDAMVPSCDIAFLAAPYVCDSPSSTNGAGGREVTEDTAYCEFLWCHRRR